MRRVVRRVGPLLGFTLLVAIPHAVSASSRIDATALQAVVDDLRARLSIPQVIQVVFVDENPMLMSVERAADHDDGFVLQVDRTFLDALTTDDLAPVVAHELGHVWIFTHHPYLQTEALANRIAMRVVSRDQLARAYDKVRAHHGAKGAP